jgi:hypothetical protein
LILAWQLVTHVAQLTKKCWRYWEHVDAGVHNWWILRDVLIMGDVKGNSIGCPKVSMGVFTTPGKELCEKYCCCRFNLASIRSYTVCNQSRPNTPVLAIERYTLLLVFAQWAYTAVTYLLTLPLSKWKHQCKGSD